jgi:hypothetical protein
MGMERETLELWRVTGSCPSSLARNTWTVSFHRNSSITHDYSIMTPPDGKRSIQSLKNQVKGRKKRDVGESLEPVYQHGPLDYEELLQSLSDDYVQNSAEKRYLGESS